MMSPTSAARRLRNRGSQPYREEVQFVCWPPDQWLFAVKNLSLEVIYLVDEHPRVVPVDESCDRGKVAGEAEPGGSGLMRLRMEENSGSLAGEFDLWDRPRV
jgi:hypothetical protein